MYRYTLLIIFNFSSKFQNKLAQKLKISFEEIYYPTSCVFNYHNVKVKILSSKFVSHKNLHTKMILNNNAICEHRLTDVSL